MIELEFVEENVCSNYLDPSNSTPSRPSFIIHHPPFTIYHTPYTQLVGPGPTHHSIDSSTVNTAPPMDPSTIKPNVSENHTR